MAGILETVREDDFIEYFLFISLPSDIINAENEEIILEEYLKKVNLIVNKYSKQYLWHKDEFKVIPRSRSTNLLVENETEELPSHLYGITHYGDNIEDEWFLVFLLLKITQEVEGLIIRVIDADGEFLLIEAAEKLPKWANPDTCAKRVYLYRNNVHIIPLDSDDNNMTMAIHEALEQIKDHPEHTEASSEIQSCIQNRILGYPEKIATLLHRTKVYLPVAVAAILKERPNLIAPAVNAFCNRDVIDLKACRMMRYFPPENRVMTSVVFTKYLYAMLTHSTYVPDQKTGWNVPLFNNSEYKAHILGIKLACGFEILISQAKPSLNVECDKAWNKYLESLKNKGYFNDLLEHSKEYEILLQKAKEYYKDNRDSMYYSPAVGQEILNLTKTLEYSIDDFNAAEASLPLDDDESWLSIDSKELEKMLEERYGKRVLSLNQDTNGHNLTNKVTEFLEHISSIEGAEYPTADDKEVIDSPPIRPKRGIKKNNTIPLSNMKDNCSKNNSKVNFDPNMFNSAIQNILDLVIPEDSWDLESGSEMSDYENEPDVSLEDQIGNDIKSEFKKYMDAMDRELASTTIGQSFEKKQTDGEDFDDIENFKPVDIDKNALKNILESYKSQIGADGPATNLLGPMGIHFEPRIQDLNIDEDE